MLISLHLPKTGGSSIRRALEKHFVGEVRLDYGDHPMRTHRGWREIRALRDNLFPSRRLALNGGCVHGHFLAVKYARLAQKEGVSYVTWLRHPVERLASHYHYWKRSGDRDRKNVFRQRVLAEDWSLEKFCLCPKLRNFYHQYFFGFEPARFDFIGITENYDRDFARFSDRFLGGDGAPEPARVNPEREGNEYPMAKDLRARIEHYHARDMDLYRWALTRSA